MALSLQQHLKEDNLDQTQTILQVKYVSSVNKKNLIGFSDYLIEKQLASEEMRQDILDLCKLYYDMTAQWLSDFSFVVPNLRPE